MTLRVCARCGVDSDDAGVVIHHKNKNRSDNRIENLIYLCRCCHRNWHVYNWSYADCGLEHTHIPSMEKYEDHDIYIRPDVFKSLIKYTESIKSKVDDDIIRLFYTPEVMANSILMEEMKKRGHYVGKNWEAAHG